jgi:hypothetical protein
MKLIISKEFRILVSDEPVLGGTFQSLPLVDKSKKGDIACRMVREDCIVFDNKDNKIYEIDFEREYLILGRHNQVVAGYGNLPKIDYSLLSPEECEMIENIDVESQMMKDTYLSQFKILGEKQPFITDIEQLGSSAQSEFRHLVLGYKMGIRDSFSFNDMIKAIKMALAQEHPLFDKLTHTQIIEHIRNTPKRYNVNVEMMTNAIDSDDTITMLPRVSNNAIKINRVLYEII